MQKFTGEWQKARMNGQATPASGQMQKDLKQEEVMQKEILPKQKGLNTQRMPRKNKKERFYR